MAKKQKTAAAPAVREQAENAPRKEHPKREYTLLDCMMLGRTANIMFVAFIVVCLIYYYSLKKFEGLWLVFEIVAYALEAGGFAFFTLSVIWMDKLVRARTWMKVVMPVYISVEVILMLLEFEFIPFISDYYNGLSLWLIIIHALFSAACAFSLIQLEPQNKVVQIAVTLTVCISLAGMLPGIAGYRVYASILVNAFAYIVFFSIMHRLVKNEEVEIDCHGDRARVTSFTTTMFTDSPLLQEKPEKQRKSLRQRAKDAAEVMTLEEQVVLTDKEESFEYEFGVQDDDEYEDEDDE